MNVSSMGWISEHMDLSKDAFIEQDHVTLYLCDLSGKTNSIWAGNISSKPRSFCMHLSMEISAIQ